MDANPLTHSFMLEKRAALSPAGRGHERRQCPRGMRRNRTRRRPRQTQRWPASARGHAFVLELLGRALVLRQMGETHPAQHVRRLGELNVVVADDLYAVAPGVAEIEERARQRLDARRRQRAADRVLVVDHETEMTAIVGGLGAALLQREELIA